MFVYAFKLQPCYDNILKLICDITLILNLLNEIFIYKLHGISSSNYQCFENSYLSVCDFFLIITISEKKYHIKFAVNGNIFFTTLKSSSYKFIASQEHCFYLK